MIPVRSRKNNTPLDGILECAEYDKSIPIHKSGIISSIDGMNLPQYRFSLSILYFVWKYAIAVGDDTADIVAIIQISIFVWYPNTGNNTRQTT